MTAVFRLEALTIDTFGGEVHYDFTADLTVLAGPTGVGKTTLFELIKFGLGLDGLLVHPVSTSISDVSVDVRVGSERFRLVRALDSARRSVVRVFDLVEQQRLRDHHVSDKEPRLSDLLLRSLDLPTDMRAAARSGGSQRAGGRITFGDLFTFMYVPQYDINKDIAHSRESYREPKRRAVFELLFGLTSPEILRLQSELNVLKGRVSDAEREYRTVQEFLRATGTESRFEAELALTEAEVAESAARADRELLRLEIEPMEDRAAHALLELLSDAERSLKQARAEITDLQRQRGEISADLRLTQADLERLRRMKDAGARLADIEFVVCPRCMQSLDQRPVESGHCRVCNQLDPVEGMAIDEDAYEVEQLKSQLEEMQATLAALQAHSERAAVAVDERAELVRSLSLRIDRRTADRVTPRLQRYADAVDRQAQSAARQREAERVLVMWDRADDVGAVVETEQRARDATASRIGDLERRLALRKVEVISSLTDEFAAAVGQLGVPSVDAAEISPTTYLPVINGDSFTLSSGGGGIITAIQVAYWSSLLAVALREGFEARYPAFLLVDSPRLALNTAEALSAALYRRLVTQVDGNQGRLQMIIADNELPAEYRKDFQQIDFTYERPTIWTVPHPGPKKVQVIASEGDDLPPLVEAPPALRRESGTDSGQLALGDL